MLEFQGETGLLLRDDSNVRIPFPTKQGDQPSSRVEEGENGALLELWLETQRSSQVGMGILGSFWGFINGVKFLFKFQEATWDFLGNTAV